MTSQLDLLFRCTAVGIVLLGVVLTARAAKRSIAGWTVTAFGVSIVAYLVQSSPALAALLRPVGLPLLTLAVAAPVLLWLTALAMFVDGFQVRAIHSVPLFVLEAIAIAASLVGLPAEIARWLPYAQQGLIAILYGASVWIAWKGYAGDLIEPRRRFRLWFVITVSVVGVTIALVEILLSGTRIPDWLELLKVVVIAAIALVLVACMIEVRPGWLTVPAPTPRPLGPTSDAPATEKPLLAALRHALEVEKVYRQEGLTIAALAARLRVPEHVLRKTINGTLGYRNFNAFLNGYRVEEVRAALADPTKARLPVLTLALEAGFGSIGPFNRAFKESLGMTPTEYRAASSLAESEKMSPISDSAPRRAT